MKQLPDLDPIIGLSLSGRPLVKIETRFRSVKCLNYGRGWPGGTSGSSKRITSKQYMQKPRNLQRSTKRHNRRSRRIAVPQARNAARALNLGTLMQLQVSSTRGQYFNPAK